MEFVLSLDLTHADCVSYFPITVVKCHKRGDLKKKAFNRASVSEGGAVEGTAKSSYLRAAVGCGVQSALGLMGSI